METRTYNEPVRVFSENRELLGTARFAGKATRLIKNWSWSGWLEDMNCDLVNGQHLMLDFHGDTIRLATCNAVVRRTKKDGPPQLQALIQGSDLPPGVNA